MADAAPWEKYATTKAEDGPWSKYQTREPTSPVADFFKSIPRGILSGVSSTLQGAAAASPDIAMGQAIFGQPVGVPPAEEFTKAAEKNITGELHKPEGRAGRVGAAVGEGLGSPMTYMGPGSLPLKVGGSVLSSAAGEAAAQGAEGTKYEIPARIAGQIAGGVAAGKVLGPGVPKATTPTYPELKATANAGYAEARNSGLELHPAGVGSWAAKAEQELTGPDHGFTGGKYGDAPRTLGVLESLQNIPPGATVTASNVDALRKNLGRLARETNEGKPTPDAAAASVVLKRFNDYTENLPQNHIVAGDAATYVRATKQANADYAASQRLRDWQTRLDNAELDASGQIAGSLENRQKIAARQILKSPKASRGLNEPEKSQLELVNSGGPVSNTLRQMGRGGAGVIPIMGQLAAAGPIFATTGGIGTAVQGGVAAALYGARKTSEAITNSRARKLVEMLAQRSPEYERRVKSLPPADTAANKAAIIRALLAH
jgi:hypothetical protein